MARRLLIVVACIGFAIAYGQAPQFHSNQNQYFLHGLAQAGFGHLDEDWLANTGDPTPIFSGMVAIVEGHAPRWTFYLIQGLLVAGYALALYRIFVQLAGAKCSPGCGVMFLLLLTLVHSAFARWASYRLFGQDYPWYFQTGVAGQYLVGPMLQPSVFGVLLLGAVALFGAGRTWLAALLIAASATIHSTYLLPGALVTIGFLVQMIREKKIGHAIGFGGLTLLLVLPATAYAVMQFRPTSSETFADAQDILANFRIPHHCRVDLWLDDIAKLQIAWIVLGIAALWGTRLALPMALAFVLAVILTIAQVASGSNGMALLFPWRISSLFMPIATAAILARLVTLLPGLGAKPVQIVAGLGIVILAAAAAWIHGSIAEVFRAAATKENDLRRARPRDGAGRRSVSGSGPHSRSGVNQYGELPASQRLPSRPRRRSTSPADSAQPAEFPPQERRPDLRRLQGDPVPRRSGPRMASPARRSGGLAQGTAGGPRRGSAAGDPRPRRDAHRGAGRQAAERSEAGECVRGCLVSDLSHREIHDPTIARANQHRPRGMKMRKAECTLKGRKNERTG